jgi:phage terminase small subunit
MKSPETEKKPIPRKRPPAKKKGTQDRDTANRYKLFADAYIVNGFNATQAAKDAGYSEKTAYAQGHRLLKVAEVDMLIKNGIKAALSNADKLTLKWMTEVCRLAFSDIRDITEFDGKGVRVKSASELSDDAARTIESIEHTTTTKGIKDPVTTVSVKTRLHSKTKALELLGKYLAILNDNPPTGGDEEQLDRKLVRERIAYLEQKKRANRA